MSGTARRADLLTALNSYAVRLHERIGGDHHVASPLGAWTLLALVGTAADGEDRAAIEEALGCDAETAAGWARALLESPHPDVAAAAASWIDPTFSTPSAADWVRMLPPSVATGPIPSQAVADAWTREHTLDLIETFPVDLAGFAPAFVLATALATKVEWRTPFEVAAAERLGTGAFAGQVSSALVTPSIGEDHEAWVAATRIGDVVVHSADAGSGLRVVSVIAREDAAPSDVIAAALEIATAEDRSERSLFDLELGETSLWTITEERATVQGGPERQERVADVVLPAWSADSTHELLPMPGVGFDAAARAVARMLDLRDYRTEARQVATARYHREGFEAAAVTVLAMRATSLAREVDAVIRTAHFRFPHPYAVVAVATDVAPEPRGRTTPFTKGGQPERVAPDDDSPWHGIPVFSAWVSRADEVR